MIPTKLIRRLVSVRTLKWIWGSVAKRGRGQDRGNASTVRKE